MLMLWILLASMTKAFGKNILTVFKESHGNQCNSEYAELFKTNCQMGQICTQMLENKIFDETAILTETNGLETEIGNSMAKVGFYMFMSTNGISTMRYNIDTVVSHANLYRQILADKQNKQQDVIDDIVNKKSEGVFKSEKELAIEVTYSLYLYYIDLWRLYTGIEDVEKFHLQFYSAKDDYDLERLTNISHIQYMLASVNIYYSQIKEHLQMVGLMLNRQNELGDTIVQYATTMIQDEESLNLMLFPLDDYLFGMKKVSQIVSPLLKDYYLNLIKNNQYAMYRLNEGEFESIYQQEQDEDWTQYTAEHRIYVARVRDELFRYHITRQLNAAEQSDKVVHTFAKMGKGHLPSMQTWMQENYPEIEYHEVVCDVQD